ncbi:hypothetical protein [Terriglobus saanensis]|uniref:Uncharacterized protein n=1 Tax=Terriglobus saanensis (strain ATCC BAA-1853 / DSM 23119 / SP1PR4) TaxID=401053 RepID=E8UXI6_TERSS|nr:hypothetical protein [Terriglobus saanensis]ADV81930.1 hypothetical protein AciPR4_1101 [Terriglobus saanensis SP1PR4]
MVTAKPEREASDTRPRRLGQLPAVGSDGARRELVRRIVHSPTFARSERLGTFLTYVCDMTFKGREAEINEQKIGREIFGRPQDYDSAVDGIVRSQASRLRQRLELYFQQEGADELVRITIPRGGYVPVFETQNTSVPTPADVEATLPSPYLSPLTPTPSVEVHPKQSVTGRWLPWGLSAVLTLMLMALWFHDRSTLQRPAIADHPLWSHLFTKNQPTMVVAPDSGLVLFHGMSGRDLDLKGYLDAGYRSEPAVLPQIGPAASLKDSVLDLANRRYTSIVDLKTILSLKDRAQTLGSEVSVRYARDLRPNDFKAGDVILLGSSEADPWDELYEHNMNFVFKDDYKGVFSILNRNPQKGEPARWESRRDDPQRTVFGVVAYMPSLAGDGNALLLEGTGMSGTEAGMDFVLDDAQLLPFLNRIRHPDGTLPHFEVLLGTQNMGASATQSHIVAWRTMN